MENIVLIGMMGCGKTTVGKRLAVLLDRELVDTDALIEKREGRTISDIFAAEGEGHFRALELELCRELSQREGLIIACGGGLPTQNGCMRLLKDRGTVFWLNRDPEKTYDSLDVSTRPLAQGGREDFLARYARRAPIYRKWANHTIANAPSAGAAAGAIAAIVRFEEENLS